MACVPKKIEKDVLEYGGSWPKLSYRIQKILRYVRVFIFLDETPWRCGDKIGLSGLTSVDWLTYRHTLTWSIFIHGLWFRLIYTYAISFLYMISKQ